MIKTIAVHILNDYDVNLNYETKCDGKYVFSPNLEEPS